MKKISPLIIILLALFVPVLSWADSNFTTLSATGTSQVVSVRKPGFWSREKTALNNRLAFWQGKFTAWGNTQAVGYSKMMGSNLENTLIRVEDYYVSIENLATTTTLTSSQKIEIQTHLNNASQSIEKAENNLVIIAARNNTSRPPKGSTSFNQLKQIVKDTVADIRVANKEIGLAHDIIKDILR